MANASASNPARPPKYLRVALVDAGLALLAIEGLAGLTLRACAARAGVSHAAPAHHFAGLPGLLTAIAARGFGIFTDTIFAFDAYARFIVLTAEGIADN